MRTIKTWPVAAVMFLCGMILLACCRGPVSDTALPGDGYEEDNGSVMYRFPGYALKIPLLEGWEPEERREKDSFTLELAEKGGSGYIIIAALPREETWEDLAAEGEDLLLKSLYNVRGSVAKTEQEIFGHRYILLSVEAGDKEVIQGTTAILSGVGESYFFTFVGKAGEEKAREDYFLLLEGVRLE